MTETRYYLTGWAVLAPAFAALWALQTRTKDASAVDAAWTFSLGAMGAFAAAGLPGDPGRRALLAAMAVLWSLRLGLHLVVDRVAGKPEDGRYAALRREWGEDAGRRFFWFYQTQAASVVVLSLSFAAAARRTAPLGALDAAAAALWALSVACEASADRALARFRAEPANRGKTCREGLWAYSRHPNYFFEWLHWVALAALAPADWRAWIAPPAMLYLLLRVTGIPLTEAQAVKSRGEDYRRYQRETSMFVPWFPRRLA